MRRQYITLKLGNMVIHHGSNVIKSTLDESDI